MSKGKSIVAMLATTMVFAFGGTQGLAQRLSTKAAAPTVHATPERSLFNEYRGVAIGTTATDVRAKLGNPKESSATDEQFIFSEAESAQFYYDAEHKVNAIMITFQGDVSKAPAAKDVFGEDVAPNDQGTIFRMTRYPKAGYWISYTRTSGADAMVNIALQKK